MKFVWSAVWLLVGIVFVTALWKTGLGNKLRRQAFPLMTISGAFIVILFPASMIFLGYLLFTIGLVGGMLNLFSGRLNAPN